MEHINQSVKIVCILRRFFPDNVVYNIRSLLRLAIDLNGYTNNEIIDYIRDGTTSTLNTKICQYLKHKYGYSRRNIYLLKRYQLIHVVQKFNIYIPICRYRINENKIFVDKYVENIKWGNECVQYKLKDDDTSYSIDNSKVISINNISNYRKTYKISILINKITDKCVKIYTFYIDPKNKLTNYSMYQSRYILMPKSLFIRLVLENTLTECFQNRYQYANDTILNSKCKYINIQNVPTNILDKIPDAYKYMLLNNFHDRLNIIQNHFTENKDKFDSDDKHTLILLQETIKKNLFSSSYIIDIDQHYLERVDEALKIYEKFVITSS